MGRQNDGDVTRFDVSKEAVREREEILGKLRKSLDAAAYRVALSETEEGTWTLTENHYREVGKRFRRKRLSAFGYVTLRVLSALGVAACVTLIVTFVSNRKTIGTTGYIVYISFILVPIIIAFIGEYGISKRFAKIE